MTIFQSRTLTLQKKIFVFTLVILLNLNISFFIKIFNFLS